MRITGLSLGILLLFSAAGVPAAEQTPFSTLSSLATYFSENDPAGIIALFDSSMTGYGEIVQNVDAITAQTDPSVALDILDDAEVNGVHKLDVDFLVQLKSKADPARVERRRERVQLEMRQIKGKWKITAFSPLSILYPIHIR